MKKPIRLFTFKKQSNKWQWQIDSHTAFYFFETYGVPLEVFEETIKEYLLDKEWLKSKLAQDWMFFVKEGQVDKDELIKLKANNQKNFKEFENIWNN